MVVVVPLLIRLVMLTYFFCKLIVDHVKWPLMKKECWEYNHHFKCFVVVVVVVVVAINSRMDFAWSFFYKNTKIQGRIHVLSYFYFWVGRLEDFNFFIYYVLIKTSKVWSFLVKTLNLIKYLVFCFESS